jgi:hypothetical protein
VSFPDDVAEVLARATARMSPREIAADLPYPAPPLPVVEATLDLLDRQGRARRIYGTWAAIRPRPIDR